VELGCGLTAYKLSGPSLHNITTKGLVVLIHGLTMASYIFQDLVPALVAANFRVLTYDIYGRGKSQYKPKSFEEHCDPLAVNVRQLVELLQKLQLWDRFENADSAPKAGEKQGLSLTLVGASLGGSIATAFAAAYPSKVSRLVLIAPAGLINVDSLPVALRLVQWVPKRGMLGWAFKTFVELMCAPCIRDLIVSTCEGRPLPSNLIPPSPPPTHLPLPQDPAGRAKSERTY
jgi:pimeloyl-ACP methyl ester carboxylesterase